MDPSIGVLVVDDHPVARSAVADLVDDTDGMSVLGTASDGAVALGLVAELEPDVVVMDVSMPVMSGIEVTQLLVERNHAARVLLFTADVRCSVVQEARRAGAVGVLAKGARGIELIRAIRRAYAGRPTWPVTKLRSRT